MKEDLDYYLILQHSISGIDQSRIAMQN
ncbi:uncharacterized protein METZ01_LOCUS74849 [marine metagenome]|uniref:Uncharacterized protein n=1 Tax=marine metagenome TaxID=408172 RepID=A0A381U1A0_9ZZZZ